MLRPDGVAAPVPHAGHGQQAGLPRFNLVRTGVTRPWWACTVARLKKSQAWSEQPMSQPNTVRSATPSSSTANPSILRMIPWPQPGQNLSGLVSARQLVGMAPGAGTTGYQAGNGLPVRLFLPPAAAWRNNRWNKMVLPAKRTSAKLEKVICPLKEL